MLITDKTAERAVNTACIDCNVCTISHGGIGEYYMVHKYLWRQAGMKQKDGMLCIGCFESRLGRTLVRADFTNYPINFDPSWASFHSDRLKDRLSRNQ